MPDPPPESFGDGGDGTVEEPSTAEGVSAAGPDGRSSELMTRLTLSALKRASTDPNLWREPVVHRAVLVSGLSVLLGSLVRLNAELERPDPAG